MRLRLPASASPHWSEFAIHLLPHHHADAPHFFLGLPPHASEAQARAAGLGPGDNYWNTTTGSLKTILP
jgi:hypothetical protein